MQETIVQFVELYGLYAVFFLMIGNGFASTPPSETTLGGAGILAAYGHMDASLVILAGVSGNVLGTTLLYLVGFRIGCDWLISLKRSFESSNNIKRKISHWLPSREFIHQFEQLLSHRNGSISIGVLRCFPVIRSIVSLPAGMVKMPLLKFVIYSSIGCLVWNSLWVGLGYFLGESWQQWGHWITVILFVILGAMMLYLKNKIKNIFFVSPNP